MHCEMHCDFTLNFMKSFWTKNYHSTGRLRKPNVIHRLWSHWVKRRLQSRWGPWVSITKDDTRRTSGSAGAHWSTLAHSPPRSLQVCTPTAPLHSCLVNLHVEENPRRDCKGWQLPGSWTSGGRTPARLEEQRTQCGSRAALSPEQRPARSLLVHMHCSSGRSKKKGMG